MIICLTIVGQTGNKAQVTKSQFGTFSLKAVAVGIMDQTPLEENLHVLRLREGVLRYTNRNVE